MQTFKKTFIFVLLNLSLCYILNLMLTQPSTLKILFNSLNKDKYSTLIVGESHGESCINPFILSEENNQAFNIARRLIPPTDFYYIVKEANKDLNLKQIIFEIDSGYWESERIPKASDANLLYSLTQNKIKIEYFFDLFANKDVTDIFDYDHTPIHIKRSLKNLKAKTTKEYMKKEESAIIETNKVLDIGKNYKYIGRGFRYGLHFDEKIKYTPKDFDKDKITQEVIESFEKLQKYCKENNIELICMISALPPYRLQKENHNEEHEYFKEFCNKYKINFYDMNYIKSEYLPRNNEDYVDIDGHMQGELANKQTNLIKEIIKSEHPEKYFEKNYEDVLKGLNKNERN